MQPIFALNKTRFQLITVTTELFSSLNALFATCADNSLYSSLYHQCKSLYITLECLPSGFCVPSLSVTGADVRSGLGPHHTLSPVTVQHSISGISAIILTPHKNNTDIFVILSYPCSQC
ncbi:Hypothetical predicted protein [Podarcis lilfordi]|uniref:Uncharacterized protein n=1 Tax=Podarcis lilfordi TaxID=74358 RepID=A0AA35LI40_9SAUR|nr:Hypothetical predicted protein [Podarcis lilfordi]